MADKDAVEAAIRHEADPSDIYSRDTIDTAGLVKSIRKRHRDALEENRRDKNAMRIEKENFRLEFEDEKARLNNTIRSRSEQDQQNRDELRELKSSYRDLRADREAKSSRIMELEEEVKAMKQTRNRVTEGSLEALKKADRNMKYQIACIEKKYQRDLTELRRSNDTLQERLIIARRLQPKLIFHRVEASTVREMQEKLVQIKKSKKKEMAVKEEEIESLRNSNDYRKRWISDLESAAAEDEKVLKNTVKDLSDTRKALKEAESKMASHQREVNRLNKWGKEWETGCESRSQKITELKSEINALRVTHHKELIRAQAKTVGLETSIQYLQEAKDGIDEELERWQNGQGGRATVPTQRSNDTLPEADAQSFVKALKSSNARANTLQLSVNALQAENAIFQKKLGDAANAPSLQIQEQLERIQSENQRLAEAAGRAEDLKTQVICQATERVQKVEEQFAKRTQELEVGFNQGFESLRELRDQWYLQKRGLEKEFYREIVAANMRQEMERQGREDRFTSIWRDKEAELRRWENTLQNRESDLLLQVNSLPSGGQTIVKTETPAKKAEEEVYPVQAAEADTEAYRDSIEEDLCKENVSQRRDGQRHLDLLNEELGKMTDNYRLQELHTDLQTANCSINCFEYDLVNSGTKSEVLSQTLYGADFDESDVQLLQTSGRPVLLAQLQAAKSTMEKLRSLLAESPDVKKDKAISILREPRGDEDAAEPIDDIFDDEDDSQQPSHPSNSRKRSGPSYPSSSRKRSGPPQGAPTYGEHEDNAAHDDGGDQDTSIGARISTPQEIAKRQKLRLRSRRNIGPVNEVQHKAPAVGDQ